MKYVPLILIVGLATVLFLYDVDNTSEKDNSCKLPLTYQIAEIDPRFGISEDEVKIALEESSSKWSQVINRSVAEYSDTGDIRVDLVYDNRQKLFDDEISFKEKIRTKEREIRSLESIHDRLNRKFTKEETNFKEQEKEFRTELDSFNDWVKERNENGGFLESEVSQYNNRKDEIELSRKRLQDRSNELNTLSNRLNEKVDELNTLIDEKNRLVDLYNDKFSGEKNFIQGQYKRNGNDETIVVYQFKDRRELRLVLAHEIGHALGIGHVSNNEAVMYDHTKDQNKEKLQLTEDDKNAIIDICGSVENIQ